MTRWRLQGGPWDGQEELAHAGRHLLMPALTQDRRLLTVVYTPTHVDGDTLVARYEGFTGEHG